MSAGGTRERRSVELGNRNHPQQQQKQQQQQQQAYTKQANMQPAVRPLLPFPASR